MLEVIATNLAVGDESIDDYVQKTLLYQSVPRDEIASMVESTLQNLLETNLVTRSNDLEYTATLLGQAIVASSLTPSDGLFVHRELRKALGAFVMDGELHALYIFTPVQSVNANINWQTFQKEVEGLDESNLKVIEFVGIKHSVINQM